ncbi:sensor histidine kinase [Jeotgalibaca dankookensis]|uniref:sensor histidine kinase n=1 Tax=Jeotgalibaca dankookensis TaxID=708126 RepID=UPI000780CBB2|nr:sensor histidine kinase [Jeotgalibaca dankookensis]
MRGVTFLKLYSRIFLILLLTVAVTIFSLRPILSIRDFWKINNYHVPVLLFLAAVVFILSFVISLMVYLTIVKTKKRLIETLQQLNSGNYNKPSKPLESFSGFGESLEEIENELTLLRQKMMQLSREVQELSSVPKLVGSETKEEILEQERHRIARELHDSVSQQLFAAMMMLSALDEKSQELPDHTQKSLKLIKAIVNESQSEMRALLLHLRPIKLEGKTLRKGIEQLLNELKTKIEIQLKWEIAPIDTIPGVEDHLFRIVQELLSNTLRHAKAKTLEVYLLQNEQEISLRIFDDGVGFDPSVTKAGSYGLMNIQERVSSLGGTCKIISFPNQGTIIDIRIPNTMED